MSTAARLGCRSCLELPVEAAAGVQHHGCCEMLCHGPATGVLTLPGAPLVLRRTCASWTGGTGGGRCACAWRSSAGCTRSNPPAVQLLRPRMRGPLAAALASHPALQLEHWDPWRPQKQLLELLRAFLQARDVAPPCASTHVWPENSPASVALPCSRNAQHACSAPESPRKPPGQGWGGRGSRWTRVIACARSMDARP